MNNISVSCVFKVKGNKEIVNKLKRKGWFLPPVAGKTKGLDGKFYYQLHKVVDRSKISLTEKQCKDIAGEEN